MKPVDTSSVAERKQLDILRSFSPEKRLKIAIDLTQTSRNLLSAGVRQRHPEYDERQVALAVIRLTLPDDVFLAAYPQASHILP